MRIVHVEEFFHPNAGYQVNLLAKIQAADGHEVTVIAAEMERLPESLTGFFGSENIQDQDRRYWQETGVIVRRIPCLGYYSGRAILHPKVFKEVKNADPDAVLVHGAETLTAIAFTLLSTWLPYPIVLDSHMVDVASQNRFSAAFCRAYRAAVAPLIKRRKIPIFRVFDDDYVQRQLGLDLREVPLLGYGTDTNLFSPDPAKTLEVRNSLGLRSTDHVVLYAGKIDESKGGNLLAETVNHDYGRHTENIVFLVITNAATDYEKKVLSSIHQSNNRTVVLPTQKYTDLADVFKAADVALFPKQCSMTFYELQSTGVPVIFEENSINQSRSQFGNAFMFTPNDAADIASKIHNFFALADGERDRMATAARSMVVANHNYLPVARSITDLMRGQIAS